MTYELAPENVALLVAKLEKLSKKATKLGCESLTWEISEPKTRLADNGIDLEVYVSLTVYGLVPQLQGWDFIAALETVGDEIMTRTMRGAVIPSDFNRHDANQTCDHCGHTRQRNVTYLVQHADKGWKRIGSTCLKDFLGQGYPGLRSYFGEVDALDDYAEGLGQSSSAFDLTKFLAVTAMHIDESGFTSRTRASEYGTSSTADMVGEWFSEVARGRQLEQPTGNHNKIAKESIAWAKELSADAGDYLANLGVLARADYVPYSGIGLAASMVTAMQRAKGKLALKEKTLNLAASKHFGDLKERGTWEMTLTNEHTFETQYGTTRIYKFVTPEGNVASWFSSRAMEMEIGETYQVTGTVKTHDEYRDIANTTITRCKIKKG